MGLAARKYDNALYTINITGSPTPQPQTPYTVMNLVDTIEFINSTSSPVSIAFTTTSGAVFHNIASLAAGANSGQISPLMNNVTVNFTITNLSAGGGTSSPGAIQVGTGPLRIDIVGGNTSPDPVSIPRGGQLQLRPDASYQVSITPPNAFSPNVTSITPTNSPVMTATNLASQATYTLVGPGIKGTKGKGTVKIGS